MHQSVEEDIHVGFRGLCVDVELTHQPLHEVVLSETLAEQLPDSRGGFVELENPVRLKMDQYGPTWKLSRQHVPSVLHRLGRHLRFPCTIVIRGYG